VEKYLVCQGTEKENGAEGDDQAFLGTPTRELSGSDCAKG